VAWDLSGELFGERQHRTPDINTLSEIARTTGGIVDPKPADLQAFMRQETARREYSHELLVVALALFLFEILLRLARRPSRVIPR
jgi:hypothetical protein